LSGWEKHAVDLWNTTARVFLDDKLLSFEVFLHDKLALSELSKEDLVRAFINIRGKKPFESIPYTDAVAKAAKIGHISAACISAFNRCFYHLRKNFDFFFELIKFRRIIWITLHDWQLHQLVLIEVKVFVYLSIEPNGAGDVFVLLLS
jgi:hypothetical protein